MPTDDHDSKPPSTEELLCAVSAGNTDAWKQLGPRLSAKLLRYFSRRFDGERARELTQETLARVVKQLPGFEPEVSFGRWVFGIARNVAADAFRERYQYRIDHEFDIDGDLVDQTTSVSSKVAALEVAGIVREEVEKLAPHLRVVIEHDLAGDGDLDALAESEQVKRPTLRTRRYRGHEELREPLAERLDIDEPERPTTPEQARDPAADSGTPKSPMTP